MITQIKDGGPAFPQAIARSEDGQLGFSSDYGLGGISIRDYFAAKALCGYLSSGKTNDRETIAAACYAYADAMLKAREEASL
jgi:hypothetical protein